MTPFAIAGIQMDVRAGCDNVAAMGEMLEQVIDVYPWVQMVVFSELCATGMKTAAAQPLPGPAEEAFRQLARRFDVWLVPGSLYERAADGTIYNTALVIDPAGEVCARYRKMFPFLPYEQGVTPGTEPCIFEIPGVGCFGLAICYDLWFPEVARSLVAMGAEVILQPSLTDTIDRQVELAIARATAACQQCFVINVNGVGEGGNGRSIICGPHGDVLFEALVSETIIPIELDLDRVRRSREAGLRHLGQPLKSFRDRSCSFPIYLPGADSSYLQSLGPLAKPARPAPFRPRGEATP